jgi:hypothetical protein
MRQKTGQALVNFCGLGQFQEIPFERSRLAVDASRVVVERRDLATRLL